LWKLLWECRLNVATLEGLAMSKMLSALVAIFAFWIVALPGPADAARRGSDGIRNFDQYEFSSVRRQRRYVRRYAAPRYYVQPNYYQPYGYQPYGYQPYYAPVPLQFPIVPFFMP
jgi:hypothetical protein